MAEIHYFQRYSSKENTVTNNTLLLFSRLYHHDILAFNKFINDLSETGIINAMVSFEQQTKGNHSVPDGSITQDSFKIIIETKLYGQENIRQIINHADNFEDEKSKVLLLINVSEIGKDFRIKVRKKLNEKNKNVKLVDTTFEDIIHSFRNVVQEHDTEMNIIINDYEKYCNAENLINIDDKLMRVLPVGDTLNHNFEYNLYYAPSSRSYSRKHKYLGLYSKKQVHGVGEIKLIVDAQYCKNKKEFSYEIVEGKEEVLSENEKNNIIQSMIRGEEDLGYQIYEGHRFFIVPKFYETAFKKTSSGGLIGAKYFDLTEFGLEEKELLNSELIAEKLRKETWE